MTSAGPWGDWPRTSRVLPWMLAAFLVMLFCIPFDSVDVLVRLPFDSKLDRFVLGAIALVWGLSLTAGVYLKAPERSRPLFIAFAAFFAIALASVLINFDTLLNLGEARLGFKKLALLFFYGLLFFIAATVIRPSELQAFGTLLIALACITAVGTIWEYRTGFNAFYAWSTDALDDIARITPEAPDPKFGRPNVTGPTEHGLAAASMLGLVLPFAVLGLMSTTDRRRKILYALATALLLGSMLGTLRKTSAIVPAAAMLTLLAYRPRALVRHLPVGIAIFLVVMVIAPGAAVSVKSQFVNNLAGRNTTQGRSTDYTAVTPDLLKYPVLGRGYGTYDPKKYRILDNENLGLIIEVGLIGWLSYFGIALATFVVAHPLIRQWDPVRGPPALAGAAACAVFVVSGTLFDVLSFPQVPYLFCFIAGLVAVAAGGPRRAVASAEARPVPRRAVLSDRVVDDEVELFPPLPAMPQPMMSPSIAGDGGDAEPDLSVIVVTHNGRDLALRTIERTLERTGDIRAEWFVVDCGSKDGTAQAIADRWSAIEVLRRDNIGFAAGNNVALDRTRGRYVLLLNPDVEIEQGTLAELVALMDDRPAVGAASVIQISPDGRLLPSIRRFPSVRRKLGEALALHHLPPLRALQERELRVSRYTQEQRVDWVVGAFLLVRRDAVEAVGGLDERFFLYSEEVDWCYRLDAAGWEVRHLPIMTIVHYCGDRGRPELTAQLTYSKMLFAEKHFGRRRATGVRLALFLGHLVRLVATPLLARAQIRSRARSELAALRISARRAPTRLARERSPAIDPANR